MSRFAVVVLFAALVALTSATRGVAGIADSPLPVIQTGATTQLLYSVPGVIEDNNNLSTFFVCTSTDTVAQEVAVECFGTSGGAPYNDATTEKVSVVPGATVRFGTHAPANGVLGGGGVDVVTHCSLATASARILSTSKKLVCTVFVADRVNDPPSTSWQLTIIAKLKQKAAN